MKKGEHFTGSDCAVVAVVVALAIPDLDHRHLVRTVPIQIIPSLRRRIVQRDGLAARLEAVPPEVARVDVGGVQAAEVHLRQGPVDDGAEEGTPDAARWKRGGGVRRVSLGR